MKKPKKKIYELHNMEQIVEQRRTFVEEQGFTQLQDAESVESFFDQDGPKILFVNSVCGCAASILPALESIKDDSVLLGTVFAGQDDEATNHARSRMEDYAPSSPNVTFLKNGDVHSRMDRADIMKNDAETLESMIEDGIEEIKE